MEITVNTKLHPVLGKPLKQSLSSRMGNRMYEKLGLDYYRFPIEVDREDLGAVVNGLKRMNVDSFGVTKPYKVEILPYLDEIDELSLKIGAVNSVRVIDKKLYGRNIDGLAFVQALVEDTGRDRFLLFWSRGRRESHLLYACLLRSKTYYDYR